jgi:biopolymer transport protein TolQ
MLGSSYLALLLQAQGTVGASSNRTDAASFLNLLATATPVSMAVLGTLVLLSVASWSIILYKLLVFRRSSRHSANFLDVFRRSNKFSEVQAVCRSLGESPLVGLFQAGYTELNAQLRSAGENRPVRLPELDELVCDNFRVSDLATARS